MEQQLSQKEKMFLEELKSQEDICIQKYNNYASQTTCPQLKQIFQNHAQTEQHHFDSLTQILSGQVPNIQQSSGNKSNFQQPDQWEMKKSASDNQQPADKKKNEYLCHDALSVEKYVSGTYDTAIFEFRDPNIRQVLNHIQSEEQQHGEELFNYMHSNGMYPVQ
ncbi:hypothetical protein Sgly_0267 [Syntrophobotulus glycolicus DSM 8271]|uniref:Coat F domain protein n=1 Tax=Syntrophobotulus glycolicus (strain DSM 8271 / FlGlyR) TaxID=645991 RepID=F0SWU6_SYNGF|nr:spore coat protein [Syntrophobotulus glycolicus]ADY54636.1 hypothetical protein Sgly_0267 [Syntrophobotulus glycolicus DSM 8271]